ncbi:MAG: hypothetical protein ABSB14_14080, partial [Candidatus Sulfotelmatobacter sp.]
PGDGWSRRDSNSNEIAFIIGRTAVHEPGGTLFAATNHLKPLLDFSSACVDLICLPCSVSPCLMIGSGFGPHSPAISQWLSESQIG